MSIFSKKSLLIFLFFIFSVSSSFASYFQQGDYQIGLRVPLTIPAFTYLKEENLENGTYEGKTLTFSDMGFRNIVAGIEVDFGIFMTDRISIGGVLGYNFGYDRGDKLFSRVPLVFKSNFFLYSSYRFDVPLSLMFGVAYTKYRSMEHFVLQTGMEIGLNVYWSANWGATFRTGLWLYPELYADGNKNNLSGFIPIVVGVTFRR